MKNALITITITLFYLVAINAQETGSFTDSRDGKVYKTVKIGNKVWMAQNFAYKPSTGNCWYYNENKQFADKYEQGYMYDWKTAKQIAPKGWHLPTLEEATALLNHYGGPGEEAYHALKEGGKSGFNLQYSGYTSDRAGYRKYKKRDEEVNLWLADENTEKTVWSIESYSEDKEIYLSDITTAAGYSVRLVKD